MKVKKLRQKLHQMCSKVGQPVPLLAFERWQFNSKLREALSGTTSDDLNTGKDKSRESCPTASNEPLLPSREDWIDEDLVHDLVRGNVKQESAEEIAKQLAYSSAKYAHELAALQQSAEEARSEEGGGRKEVVTRVVEGVVDLFWGSADEKPYMRISRAHFEKLRILFARHREAAGREEEEDGQAFLGAVFCVLLRYDALGGHGYQAALGSESFDVLLAQMNCTHECFASPFNCRYDRFCSGQ
jgi:phosphorylated CTD-interacting factor 1